jgi:hypothetical protein
MIKHLIPTSMSRSVNATYEPSLKNYVSYIAGKGAYAIVDLHNFGRYYGNGITNL